MTSLGLCLDELQRTYSSSVEELPDSTSRVGGGDGAGAPPPPLPGQVGWLAGPTANQIWPAQVVAEARLEGRPYVEDAGPVRERAGTATDTAQRRQTQRL